MALKDHALSIMHSAIDAVKPDQLIPNAVKLQGNLLELAGYDFDLDKIRHIYVLGAGKASAAMAFSLEQILGEHIAGGLVITRYEHAIPCTFIDVYEAGHPVLDEQGLKATAELLALAERAGEGDLVICLISGGCSALLELLPINVSLADAQATFQLLLNCGASIEEFNTIRKHISCVKGGSLARAISPAHCVSLIISDVIGDPVEAIGSGPTAPDSTTFADAWTIIEAYALANRLPESVLSHLRQGLAGALPETLKPGHPVFKRVKNIVLANSATALEAAQQTAEKFGFEVTVFHEWLAGEARIAGEKIVDILHGKISKSPPGAARSCLLFSGETTVTIRGEGKGGRNQELVLSVLPRLKNLSVDYAFLSCGTDGTDGPTEAAGAIVTPDIWPAIATRGLDPASFLQNNDAYHFFEATGGLLITGPTGTNVMDIVVVVWGAA